MPITTKSVPTRPGITLVNGQFYPHSFTPTDLRVLAAFIKKHKRIVLLKDFAAGDREAGTVSIRHDVDHSAEHAVKFARWEAQQQITASYYLLPTAPYYPTEAKKAAQEIQRLGHEVGIHNDAYTTARGNTEAALEMLRSWAAEMRSWGIDVHGCADHGGGSPNNTELWRVKNRSPQEAGLEYEAYLLHQQGAHYLSDSHGKWNGPVKKEQGKPTHILVHPCHWEVPNAVQEPLHPRGVLD